MKKGKPRWVAVSGGFDPLHIGHVRLFQAAKKRGDKLIILLNNDNWLKLKKGFVFMPEKERKEIIEAFSEVDRVVLTRHTKDTDDISVCEDLKKLKPYMFVKGGDRTAGNIPEYELCKKLGIKMAFNVGKGGKVQSSSSLAHAASRPVKKTVRPWGEYYGWDSGKLWNLKTIYIKPRKRLSLQIHRHRSESWVLVEGDATATIVDTKGKEKKTRLQKDIVVVPAGTVHRLQSEKGAVIVEIASGKFDEADIVRLQDDYGRK